MVDSLMLGTYRVFATKKLRKRLLLKIHGGGGGVGISRGIENTQLIDFSRRQKRRTRQNCAQPERIWNAAFSGPSHFSISKRQIEI